MNSQTIDNVERLYRCSTVHSYGECRVKCPFSDFCIYLVIKYDFPWSTSQVDTLADKLLEAQEHYCTVIYAEGE